MTHFRNLCGITEIKKHFTWEYYTSYSLQKKTEKGKKGVTSMNSGCLSFKKLTLKIFFTI